MFLKRPIEEKDRTAMRMVLAQVKNKIRPEPSCDFCGDPNPVNIFGASHSSTGENIPSWRWAACEDCTVVLDHEEYDLIENKMVLMLRNFLKISDSIIRLASQLTLEEFRRYAIRVSEEKDKLV